MTGTATRLHAIVDDLAPSAERGDIVGDARVYKLDPPFQYGKRSLPYVAVCVRREGTVLYAVSRFTLRTSDARLKKPFRPVDVLDKEEALSILGYVCVDIEHDISFVRELPGDIDDWQTVFKVTPPLAILSMQIEVSRVVVLKSYVYGQMSADVYFVPDKREVQNVSDLEDVMRRGDCLLAPQSIGRDETTRSILMRTLQGRNDADKVDHRRA